MIFFGKKNMIYVIAYSILTYICHVLIIEKHLLFKKNRELFILFYFISFQ